MFIFILGVHLIKNKLILKDYKKMLNEYELISVSCDKQTQTEYENDDKIDYTLGQTLQNLCLAFREKQTTYWKPIVIANLRHYAQYKGVNSCEMNFIIGNLSKFSRELFDYDKNMNVKIELLDDFLQQLVKEDFEDVRYKITESMSVIFSW